MLWTNLKNGEVKNSENDTRIISKLELGNSENIVNTKAKGNPEEKIFLKYEWSAFYLFFFFFPHIITLFHIKEDNNL